ncbi:MAG TPA: S8 family serine peptidase [Candidatus Binataceae bacterium]|nr:S8 family serine peptidase [Candidatus Binataceae bacterium]
MAESSRVRVLLWTSMREGADIPCCAQCITATCNCDERELAGKNMNYHVICKLREPLAEDLLIPSWLDFITDKSVTRVNFIPPVDQVFADAGAKFWVTREYDPQGDNWNPEEINEGLNRTYRLILQQDYNLPENLVARIRLVPQVEDVHGLDVQHAKLPEHQIAAQTSLGPARVAEMIYLPYAKSFTCGIPDIKVAVLDTGVNLDHPELQGKLMQGYDFVNLEGLDTSEFIGDFLGYDPIPEDEVGHGTHVSGIVAAKGLRMDEGVCPGCTIMPVRVLGTLKVGDRLSGAGIVDNINTGIKWAVDNGADIINMSLGIKNEGGGLPHEDVIRYALSKNVTVVAASGNDGTSERYYPGALPGVFAVGAVDDGGAVTNFTSYGATIFVVAPGMNIYSSFAHRSYAFASGTSQASPFVTGSVALFKSYAKQNGHQLTHHEIASILKSTSDKIDSRLRDERAGYGLINLADAFKLLTNWIN